RTPGATLGPIDWNAELKGTLYRAPYPRLVLPGDNPGAIREVLLVRGGKNGVPTVTDEQEGQTHVAKGALFRRDGRELLELYSLNRADGDPQALPPSSGTKEVSLQGVLVDSKCYFGRMKPGAGQAHRACAQYCVWSGIPPVLVVYSDAGAHRHLLVTDRNGAPANEMVLEYLAESVEVRGTLVDRPTGEELRVHSIRRLP
ncbi:MAG: hypothetical protein AAFQ82_23580, partial [Myxococcota bacterium]